MLYRSRMSVYCYTAVPDVLGFDCNQPVSAEDAATMFTAGYRFALRYVRRDQRHAYDLTADEARGLFAAGLGLMLVQHVAPSPWVPSVKLGYRQGIVAGYEADALGIPSGALVWCDLEGVAPNTDAERTIDYCNAWHAEVARAGYLPGLYVGWQCGLDGDQLYHALRFAHYWAAYNLNGDEEPSVRGCEMRQHALAADETAPSVEFLFQNDRIDGDALGGVPVVVAPYGWREWVMS